MENNIITKDFIIGSIVIIIANLKGFSNYCLMNFLLISLNCYLHYINED